MGADGEAQGFRRVGTDGFRDAVAARRPAASPTTSQGETVSTNPLGDSAGHPLRHDPPRRHAGREHHALAGRQAPHRPHARRVRHALRRGRLAGLQPQGHRVLRGRPDDDLEPRQAGGVRLHARTRPTRRRGPEPARAGARRRRRSSPSSASPGTSTSSRSCAATLDAERGHDRRVRGLRRRARPRGHLRRRALLRRLQGRP